jgi:hypothetical protein
MRAIARDTVIYGLGGGVRDAPKTCLKLDWELVKERITDTANYIADNEM